MASIGSFPFAIDTSMKTCRRTKSCFNPHQTRKCLVLACLGGLTVGCCSSRAGRVSLNCGTLVTGFCPVHGGKIFRSKAQLTDSSDVEDDSESEDTLQATIEKRKKLQQITERINLVTSIRSNVIDPDGEEVSYKESSGSSSTLDAASAYSNAAVEDYKDESISSSSDLFPLDDDHEVPPSVENYKDESISSKDFGESLDEVEKEVALRKASISDDSHLLWNSTAGTASDSVKEPEDLNVEIASLDTNDKKHVNDISERVKPDVPPSFFSSSSTVYNIKQEKDENFQESKLEEIENETSVPMNEDVKPPPLAGPNVMNVILVAAECAPWSKTGGLGDVAGALPKALARRGHRVMVVVPLYGNYAEPQATGVRKTYRVDGQSIEVNYFHTDIDGVDFVFIESPMLRGLEYNIYGGKRVDILKRMILFCKAAIEVPWHVSCGGVCYGDGNLVFIANDWHTALLPVYLKAYYRDNGLMKYTRSVLVIHNIAYQGRGPVDDFSFVDLPPHYVDLFKMYDPMGGEHFNIFAAGLKTADRIVTVSRGYAWELKTCEGGWGLHEIINENDWKLRGIVNGIDMEEWNPELDVHLQSDGYTNYSLETLQTGKPKCKAALQKELGLPVRADVPLIGFIGRLDHQKGVDLIAEAIPWMMGQDVQLVMLGTGRDDLEQMLKQFESQHRDKVRGCVGFSVKTAHRITAGCDTLLMPSRFEPCGLNQLYAMCYGTVPVVHAVGGLRDTVQPFDPYGNSGLGWTFARADANQLIDALGNCLLTYRQYKESWEGIQRRGMMQELSWDNAAQNYEEVLVDAKYQW